MIYVTDHSADVRTISTSIVMRWRRSCVGFLLKCAKFLNNHCKTILFSVHILRPDRMLAQCQYHRPNIPHCHTVPVGDLTLHFDVLSGPHLVLYLVLALVYLLLRHRHHCHCHPYRHQHHH